MDEIIERLKGVILMVEPNVAFVKKYGGLIVESNPGQPKSHFCGIFAYTRHVSLEFTQGSHLEDPDQILEGSGKYRRHIKISRLTDITERRCEEFLRQARGLQGDFLSPVSQARLQ
jgi:hypothetical protein